MRRVLACARCRGHKIKCVHNNQPPCSYCQHKGIAEKCVLSFPPTKKRKKAVSYSQDATAFPTGYDHQKKLEQRQPLSVPSSDSNQMQQQQQKQQQQQQESHMYNEHTYGAQKRKKPLPMDVYRADNNTQLRYPQQQNQPLSYVHDVSAGPQELHLPQQEFRQSNTADDLQNSLSHMDKIFEQDGRAVKSETREPSWKFDPQFLYTQTIYDLARSIPHEVVLSAIERVWENFPELRFFNMDNIFEEISSMNPVLIGAIMAQASFYCPCTSVSSPNKSLEYQWLGADAFNVKNLVYEKLAMDAIFNRGLLLAKPDIEIVKALLLLCTNKWGHNEYYMSWMVHGCAARMIQVLFFDESFLQKCRGSPALQETKMKTYWSAFLLDRVICTGENRSFVIQDYQSHPLPSENINIDSNLTNNLPMNEDLDFSRKKQNGQYLTLRNFNSYFSKYPATITSKRQAFLIKIYSIWGDLNRYLIGGAYDAGQNCKPWDSSTIIGQLWQELNDWRTVLPQEWLWSKEKYMDNNSPLRKDTIFPMMNCLYLLSIIFITREFLPFLPHSVDKPDGSKFGTPPSEDYWEENARRCFQATRELCQILSALFDDALVAPSDLKIPNPVLNSPFYSFTAFICIIQCNYGIYFPWMDPDNHIYETDVSNPQSLVYGSNKVFRLLCLKQEVFPLIKNWVTMVIKTQELYRFVSNNRERAKNMNWASSDMKDIKEALRPVSETGSSDENGKSKKQGLSTTGEKGSSTVVSKDSLQSQSLEPSLVGDSYSSTALGSEKLPQQKMIGAKSGFGSFLQQNGSTSNFQADKKSSAFLPPQVVHPNLPSKPTNGDGISTDRRTGSISENTQLGQFNLYGNNIDLNNFNNVLFKTPDINVANLEVEPETDKLTLLFNDHELDLLLQFPV
ncbi:Zn(II)2Cys6 transcription factor Ecym_5044 [Eremothecium cymbalariae DBVPG|uniref:Zn(2)-C6 fungal-type domain-containing protein n=1 Tax=Eremothecium cymbalariae (strain CBS 270.75 / DBVPG 7215 / KCTC 17166 / NRRL Y-17582) TaxID=931890 RepID=I6NCP7_ERECY|nr:hypothetical protein Ecym_5044 [Eremothecium cymbalariae DBVPG\